MEERKIGLEEGKELVEAQEAKEEKAAVAKEEQPKEAAVVKEEEAKEAPVKPLLSTEETPKEEKAEKVVIDDILPELQSLIYKDDLSDEDLKPFMDKGFTKTELQLAIKGLRSEADAILDKLYDTVGGKGAFTSMAEWANKTLSKEEKEEFNALMLSGDPKVMKWALLGLKAQYLANTQQIADGYIDGSANTREDIVPFSSPHEMFEALTDTKKLQNPKYRELVEKRALISKFD
jgi:hypothetical protein